MIIGRFLWYQWTVGMNILLIWIFPKVFYEVVQLHMVCSVFYKLLFDKVIPVSVARLDGDNSRFNIMNIILILFQGHCYD